MFFFMQNKLISKLILFIVFFSYYNGISQTAAPSAAGKNSWDVISIFSGAYTDLASTNFNPNWGQSGFRSFTTPSYGGDAVKQYANFNYQGTETLNDVNASSFPNMHIDIYSATLTSIRLSVIKTTGSAVEKPITLTLTPGAWTSFDLDLTSATFTGLDLTKIRQLKYDEPRISGTISNGQTFIVDNIYFWRTATSQPVTLSDFSVPAKFVGDSSFSLTAPTTNGSGAFTYTSSNLDVATISGSTVTVVGPGSSTITATQAADGTYASGFINATLNVTYATPSSAAPTPPARNAWDVISIFSGAYTDLASTNFNPNWGQSGFRSFTTPSYGGDAVKQYANFNYQGTETLNDVNASSFPNMHIDIYSATLTSIRLSVIKTTGSAVEKPITLTLTPGAWTSFDLDLTSATFTGLDLTKIRQLKYDEPRISGTISNGQTFIVDNIYFWRTATSQPVTLSDFSVPAKFVGDSSFSLTAPTTNGSGAFTYTSSNLDVATISGSTVTVVGPGSSTITATQAADGSYSAASTTASLVVSLPPLSSSNLPIVVITTEVDPNTNKNREIIDAYRIFANMKIIKRPDGTANYLTDSNIPQYLNYDGKIDIEIRGSSSQSLPKKPYGLSTLLEDNSNNNVSLLDMPKENDWILNSLAYDPSLIRDYISYNLSRQMGNYAARTAYCEVIINNKYQGLYLLQEKIKADSNRVNILRMTTTDNTLPNISGGYITKADKTTGDDPVAWTMPSYSWPPDFIHDLPNPDEVTTQQNDYIKDQFFSLASTSKVNNSSFSNGYPSFIDVPSFIDFMILNELASNADGYQFSTYFHKDRNGKLRAGPIWDFNLTYGNDLFDSGYDRSKTDVWQFSDGGNDGAIFWTDLYNNATFKCYLSRRWNQLLESGQPLNYAILVQFIDKTVNIISEALVRENQKWRRIPDHSLEITNLKAFLSTRISWMTNRLGSFSNCNSIVTPSLVINKINYNPLKSNDFTESDDLEFIEIKNTGLTTINLTGYYFKELGLTYIFPPNSTILANKSIYLASNSTVFKTKYGITAFGQFTRNLSNSSQKLVLVDAFGNEIDSVEYFDKSPWPDADGNGSYLQLMNTDLDNSLPTSWVAVNNETLTNNDYIKKDEVSIYPNPTSQIVNVYSKNGIKKVEVFDVLGSLIFSSNKKSDSISIDFSSYSKGIYFVAVFNELGLTTKKIVKL